MNDLNKNFETIQKELQKVYKNHNRVFHVKRQGKGIDWTKKDMFNAIGRPELRPWWMINLDDKKSVSGHYASVNGLLCDRCHADLATEFEVDAEGNESQYCGECQKRIDNYSEVQADDL